MNGTRIAVGLIVSAVVVGVVGVQVAARILFRQVVKRAVIAHSNPIEILESVAEMPADLVAVQEEASALGFAMGAEYTARTPGYGVTVAAVSMVSEDGYAQLTAVRGYEPNEPPPLYNLISRLDAGGAMLSTQTARTHPGPPEEFVQTVHAHSVADLLTAHRHALEYLATKGVLPDRLDRESTIETAQWEHELASRLFARDVDQAVDRLAHNMTHGTNEGEGLLADQRDAADTIAAYVAARGG